MATTQQTINREVYSLVSVIKDDIKQAVANFVKQNPSLSQSDATILTALLLQSVDNSMIKAHGFFDKKLAAALQNK